MILAALLASLGGVTFIEQDFEGMTLQPGTFRGSDLDGDGVVDLALAGSIVLQRDGQLSKANQHAMPPLTEAAYCDVWERSIFMFFRNRLDVIQWSESGWTRTHSQRMDWAWTEPTATARSEDSGDGPELVFSRFLTDLDGDGGPELIWPDPEGVRVFARKNVFFERVASWPILPAESVRRLIPQGLWPNADRMVDFPSLSAEGEVNIREGIVRVLDPGWGLGENRTPTITQYRLDEANPFEVDLDSARTGAIGPIPFNAELRDLDSDREFEAIHIDRIGTTSGPFPLPILEVAISMDGWKTITRRQGVFLWPSGISFSDIDGDGKQDLVALSTSLFSKGIRESVIAFTSQRGVDYRVQVWLQREGGKFPDEADIDTVFPITLDKPPIQATWMGYRFSRGELFLDADFDGDGLRDAVLHDRPNRLAVYAGSTKGFAKHQPAIVESSPNCRFAAEDVNGDGRSDLLVASEGGTRTRWPRARVFLAQVTTP